MTTCRRGDVVEASDPFTERESGRPFLIANTDTHPFSDEQYVTVTLTTKAWYDGTIPLVEEDFVDGACRGTVSSSPGVSPLLHTATSRPGSVAWTKW